ncbi:large proline-rich protein BAG6 isoform X2 [Ochlerotatus camptorhynchus]|uniref:large proline-rich protein BAG6 isoform X2 n=1 Tax=Ochlerotatus camptorhynchus TaxID=644619 RepID=UPI0031E38F5B
MINLKVKTLDSQNHDFSVEDDITVRQFKEQIAEKINVAVDMQRLIYCGRVLSEDKALKEYDVNGKVVHLVQRAPPSARGSSTSGGGSSLGDDGARASARRSRSSDNAARPQIFRGLDDFNTMYFGSMTSIPLNVNATTPPQIPTVSPSSTLCMNRITVARHMLQCADNIISYLEAPERGLNNTAMDILSQQTMESTVFEVGISAVGDVDIPHNQMQNFVQAFQGAVSAAFRQNGISNVTVQQQDTLNPSVQVFGTIPDSAIITPPNTSATATPAQESSGASSGGSSTSSSTSESSADSRRQARPGSSRNQTTSTQTLAEVVQQIRGVQRRMEPFLQQYFEILQNDPTFEESDTTGRESAQRVFDRISEALHYMSHAQHAISDLMLDLQTAAPRHLCCRPILVEQSAFNNINLANLLRATNNNNNPDMGNNNINAQIINLSIPGLPGSAPNGPITVPLLEPVVQQNRATGATGPTSGTGSTPATAASTAGTGTSATQSQNQQQGQSGRSANNLPDDVVTRVYIPLFDNATVRRMQNIVETMGAPPARDGSAGRAPRSSSASSANRSGAASNSTMNDEQQQQQQQTASPSSSTTNSRTTSESDSTSSSSPERLSNSNNAQMQVARLIQAVVNAAPMNADIHVQINAGGNPPGSSAASTPGTGGTTTSNGGGPQANPTMTNNTSTNTNSGSNDNGSQSRFATVTLPTTSTQTRSTSRPHVHSIPPAHIRNVRPIPANMLSSFDRFLPCNSHHIRENTDRASTETASTRNAASANNAGSNNSNSGATPTVATSQPSAPPPESLSSLPFNLFGSQFTLGDFEQIVPNPNTLNRVRDSLQVYVVDNLFSGQAISDSTMQDAINQLIQRLVPVLSRVSNYDLPDYDTRASIENLIRNSIPFCINLIREDNSQQFGVRLLRFLITFVRRFFMILVTGIGQSNAQSFSRELLNMAIFSTQEGASVNPELLQLFLPAIHRQLERSSNHDQQDIQEFLVIRRHAPEHSQTSTTNRAPSPMEVDDAESSTTPELVSDIAEISISIEPPIVNLDQCAAIVISAAPVSASAPAAPTAQVTASGADNNEDVTMTIPVAVVDPQVPPPLTKKDGEEELPSVVVGSEPWHTHLPSTWLPVITRDIARQRRQNPQGPYSDAYISGMSSKRRKLIAETKPSSDVPSLISDGVRQAFHSTGINPASASSSNSNGLDELANTISDDAALQSSYCETMKASIRERLTKDPDYDAKRFPNCSKYFEK